MINASLRILILLGLLCATADAREFTHNKTGSTQTLVDVNGTPYINPATGKQKYFNDNEAAIVFCAQLGQTSFSVKTCAYRRSALAGVFEFADPPPNAPSAPVPIALKKAMYFSWTAPTTRADNTALQRSDIAGYTLLVLDESPSAEVLAFGTIYETISVVLNSGTYSAWLITTDMNDSTSAPSSIVRFSVP